MLQSDKLHIIHLLNFYINPLLTGSVVAAAVSVPLQAAIFDTTGSSSVADSGWSAGTTFSQGQLIHLGWESVINSVGFQWKKFTPTATGAISWSIYTDQAGAPGTPVSGGAIGVLDVSTLTSSYTTVSFSSLAITLSPNTDYWVVFAKSGPLTGTVLTTYSTFPTGTGGPFNAWQSDAGTIPGVSFIGTVTAVPEPGSYAFVGGLGLVGFGLWRQSRRNA
jgi:hypothetical protein